MSLFSRTSRADSQPPRRRRTTDEPAAERKDSLYQRGRTLAGATSHTLRAADSRALSNATPREKVHHLTSLRRRLSVILGASLGVILLLVAFLYQFTAGVQIGFSGARPASSAPYEQAVQEYLAQNPLERLRFNLNVEKLNTFVAAKLPEVQQVSAGGYAQPAVSQFSVALRQPVVSWNVDATTYFVDAHGVSFTKNVYQNPTVTIVDNSGVEHTSGTAIASERFLAFVGKAVAAAQQNGHKVTKVAIPAGTSRQVELYVEGHGYPVIMSIDRSAGEQAEDMARVLAYFDKQGRTPRYIDTRVKGKAFFRE